MTKKRIHLIYSIVLSASAIIAGICLIVACIGIYRSGDAQPFHAESVAAAFYKIDFVIYICLASMIGGFVLNICYPLQTEKKPVSKQYGVILERLQAKLDMSACEPALGNAIAKEQQRRKMRLYISFGLLIACSILFLCYALNIKNFPENHATESVMASMKVFLPCLAVPFGYGVFAAYCHTASLRREIDLTKQAIAKSGSAAAQPAPIMPKTKNFKKIATYAILCVAIAFLAFGAVNSGMTEVFGKAAQLCKECVGLG